ncbi:hypothetical protein [Mycobacterium sp. E342]|uniref:hypothetical protein n=1 Tax=Mycobacterium sp. E342 TaxID=1834147 RepID=UPI000B028E9E|nr:hypothetical protein [Mycobacterium sp. E342]
MEVGDALDPFAVTQPEPVDVGPFEYVASEAGGEPKFDEDDVVVAASPRLRTRALQLGLLTDLLDVIAAIRGFRARTLSSAGAIVAGGGAALFAGLGVAALSGREESALRSA